MYCIIAAARNIDITIAWFGLFLVELPFTTIVSVIHRRLVYLTIVPGWKPVLDTNLRQKVTYNFVSLLLQI